MEIAGAVVHGKLLRRMLNPRDISAEPRQGAGGRSNWSTTI
jgi:hypothetical protein